MSLFGKRNQSNKAISNGDYYYSLIPPDVMPLLEATLVEEMRLHPNDIWNEQTKKDVLGLMFQVLARIIVDTMSAKLPNDDARKKYNEIMISVSAGRKTGADRDNFLRQYIPNLEAVYAQIGRDFYNGSYENYEPAIKDNRIEVKRIK